MNRAAAIALALLASSPVWITWTMLTMGVYLLAFIPAVIGTTIYVMGSPRADKQPMPAPWITANHGTRAALPAPDQYGYRAS